LEAGQKYYANVRTVREEMRSALFDATDDPEILRLRKKRKIIKRWGIFFTINACLFPLLLVLCVAGIFFAPVILLILIICTLGLILISSEANSDDGVVAKMVRLWEISSYAFWVLLPASIIFITLAVIFRKKLRRAGGDLLYYYYKNGLSPNGAMGAKENERGTILNGEPVKDV
jgi:predicted membrane channel-forming protein YqfA (hemolysin III family)